MHTYGGFSLMVVLTSEQGGWGSRELCTELCILLLYTGSAETLKKGGKVLHDIEKGEEHQTPSFLTLLVLSDLNRFVSRHSTVLA